MLQIHVEFGFLVFEADGKLSFRFNLDERKFFFFFAFLETK